MAAYDLTEDSTTFPKYANPSTAKNTNPMHGTWTKTTRVISLKDMVTGNDTLALFNALPGATVVGGSLQILEAPNEAIDIVIGVAGTTNGFLASVTPTTTTAVGKQYIFDGALLSVLGVLEVILTLANVGAALTAGKIVVTLHCVGNASGSATNNT